MTIKIVRKRRLGRYLIKKRNIGLVTGLVILLLPRSYLSWEAYR